MADFLSKIGGLFGGAQSSLYPMTEEERKNLGRMGLLQAGLAVLANNNNADNPLAAISSGLLSGVQGIQQGTQDYGRQKYVDAINARTVAGMDRNSRLEQLQSELMTPDGQLDEQKFRQYAALDPQGAKAYREAINGPRTRWQLGRIGDGQGGEVDVVFDPLDPAGSMQTIDGQRIGGGLPAQPQTPQFGILRDAVEQVESGGDPLAVSPAGAIGPMQTMPGTLRDPGFGVAPASDNSVEEQRRVGNDYLRAMLNQYGDPRLALAAYNAGPGRVDQAMAGGGGVDATLARLPQETRDYVPKVLNRAGGAQAQSGFGRRPAKAQTQERKPTDLERRIELARQMGASEDEIKRLVLGQSAPSTRDALGGKPLLQGTVEKLTKDAGKLTNLQELAAGFQDEFAGNKVGGNAENLAGRLGLGGTPGQADWWQQYDRYKNQVRNELFGASLTTGEQAAFEAADITPNMSPAVVRQNMSKQAEIIRKGLERSAKVWGAQGYNLGAIEAATGVSLQPDQPNAGADRPQTKRLKYNPATGKLE